MNLLSPVRLLATPWTLAHQAPPSIGFSRQEYWSGLSVLTHLLFSSRCALSFPALAALVSLDSARGLAAGGPGWPGVVRVVTSRGQ